MSTYAQVVEVLGRKFGRAEERLTPVATLADIDFDSLGSIELSLTLEDTFDILVADDELPQTITIQEIATMCDAKLRNAA